MITLQHKTTFKKKHVDVREWLNYTTWQVNQHNLVQVNGVVKLFCHQRYLGLFEEKEVQALLPTGGYWVVRDLNEFDYFNLLHRTPWQRVKGLAALIAGRKYARAF